MPSFAVALPTLAGRLLRPSRAHLWLALAVVASLWVVLAFGRTMGALNDATERAATVRAQNAELTRQLAQAQAEASLLQSDAYLRFAARSFGMGLPGEHAFGLAPGARAPAPMVPLGGAPPTPTPPTPLENWLRVLFGD